LLNCCTVHEGPASLNSEAGIPQLEEFDMRITPLDVRKQEFRKAVRGFDCDEVRAFLSTLADEYETVLVDNKQIREMIMEQEDKIQEYQGMERNLRDTLMTAERVMQETRDNASKKGDLIVKDAEMKARQVLEECRMRTEELRREIMTLRQEKESYLGRFKSLAAAQIKFVETHENDFEDLDKRLTKIVDSVVATATHTRRRSDSHNEDKAQAQAAPAQELDPFSADNRIAGDPSTPRESGPGENDVATTVEETLEVAPPAVPHEDDVWRDYNPGTDENEAEEPNGIADLVSESLAETNSVLSAEAENTPASEESQDDKKTFNDGPVLTNGKEPVGVGASNDTI
jgi:cell division initiation protein